MVIKNSTRYLKVVNFDAMAMAMPCHAMPCICKIFYEYYSNIEEQA